MKPMVTVKQAAAHTGLSEWELKRGIREGDYPYIRIGEGRGKFLIDLDLLERALEQKALSNMTEKKISDTGSAVSYGRIRRVAQ